MRIGRKKLLIVPFLLTLLSFLFPWFTVKLVGHGGRIVADIEYYVWGIIYPPRRLHAYLAMPTIYGSFVVVFIIALVALSTLYFAGVKRFRRAMDHQFVLMVGSFLSLLSVIVWVIAIYRVWGFPITPNSWLGAGWVLMLTAGIVAIVLRWKWRWLRRRKVGK